MSDSTGSRTGSAELPAPQAQYDATRARRRQKRSGRNKENDIKDLNITPMLDMMTILLVFLLKSFASSSTDVNVANLVLPHSTTKLNVEEALQLMITKEAILVEAGAMSKHSGLCNLPVWIAMVI